MVAYILVAMCPILVQSVVAAVNPPVPPPDDRITMLLTAVGVAVSAAALMLGIVSFYIAYIAFVGKREIIQKAEAAAKQAAEEYLERDEALQELDEPAIEPEPELDDENENGNGDGTDEFA
jgi:hypothetical protein